MPIDAIRKIQKYGSQKTSQIRVSHHLQHGVWVTRSGLVLVKYFHHVLQEVCVQLVDEVLWDALALLAGRPLGRGDGFCNYTRNL
jgi:hypothetical protein